MYVILHSGHVSSDYQLASKSLTNDQVTHGQTRTSTYAMENTKSDFLIYKCKLRKLEDRPDCPCNFCWLYFVISSHSCNPIIINRDQEAKQQIINSIIPRVMA